MREQKSVMVVISDDLEREAIVGVVSMVPDVLIIETTSATCALQLAQETCPDLVVSEIILDGDEDIRFAGDAVDYGRTVGLLLASYLRDLQIPVVFATRVEDLRLLEHAAGLSEKVIQIPSCTRETVIEVLTLLL